MSVIHRSLRVGELAAIISDALYSEGISAVLSGGSVVTIYSDNEYVSSDLDFVTAAGVEQLDAAMRNIGFTRGAGRHYEHPECDYVVEFPPAPVMVGSEPVHEWAEERIGDHTLRLLTPTQSVKDRLAAFYHWTDRQCLDQAVMIARRHPIDFADVEAWSNHEGHRDRFREFQSALRHVRRKR